MMTLEMGSCNIDAPPNLEGVLTMRLGLTTLGFILLFPLLLLTTSNPAVAMSFEKLANDAKELHSKHLQVQTFCQMRFTLKGWSAFYKTASGSGALTCDNGQKAKV